MQHIANFFLPPFAKLYRHPNFCSPDDVIPDLTGKVAIVTGGTGGLGFETALQLARKGAKVYVAGRSAEKGSAAVEKIRTETGSNVVEFLEVDLADIKKTKSAAETFLATNQPLHILVNNAGLLLYKFALTPRDKIESHIAVEVGHFVFTNALLPAIRSAGPGARIVNVSSYGHTSITKPLPLELMCSADAEKAIPSPVDRYGAAKLIGIQFAQALQRRLAGDGIYVNCCHPGAIASDFNRDLAKTFGKLVGYALVVLEKLSFFQSTQVGAMNQLYLATSPEVESKGIKGEYYWPIIQRYTDHASALARDEAEQERYWVWAESVVDAALKRQDD